MGAEGATPMAMSKYSTLGPGPGRAGAGPHSRLRWICGARIHQKYFHSRLTLLSRRRPRYYSGSDETSSDGSVTSPGGSWPCAKYSGPTAPGCPVQTCTDGSLRAFGTLSRRRKPARVAVLSSELPPSVDYRNELL